MVNVARYRDIRFKKEDKSDGNNILQWIERSSNAIVIERSVSSFIERLEIWRKNGEGSSLLNF